MSELISLKTLLSDASFVLLPNSWHIRCTSLRSLTLFPGTPQAESLGDSLALCPILVDSFCVTAHTGRSSVTQTTPSFHPNTSSAKASDATRVAVSRDVPPFLYSAILHHIVLTWRRTKTRGAWKHHRRPTISRTHSARLSASITLEALVISIGAILRPAATVHSKSWTTRARGASGTISRCDAEPALRARLLTPPITASLLALLFVVSSLFMCDLLAGHRAIGTTCRADGRNPVFRR
ncbi:hypothetical protein C8R44DRAFT_890211 [Mycena epipterygia]|nr:hypothetical protein C8R44DRAFT_890211 [Mycena epipterygia]